LEPDVSGVIRCFRPLPVQLTCAPTPRWTSLNRVRADLTLADEVVGEERLQGLASALMRARHQF